MRSLGSCLSWQFQSTPSARRATATCTPNITDLGISIHALREEGDDGAGR